MCLASAGAGSCPVGKSFGEIAIRTNNDSTFSFFNTNGFFDRNSSNARIRWNINDAEFYLAQTFSNRRNLLILNNIISNSRFDGKLTIGATEGIWHQGTFSFSSIIGGVLMSERTGILSWENRFFEKCGFC